MEKTYVIGLYPTDLIRIEESINLVTGKGYISRIIHGYHSLSDVTIIEGRNLAEVKLKEIQDNSDRIHMVPRVAIESLLKRNDFNPKLLQLFEIQVQPIHNKKEE